MKLLFAHTWMLLLLPLAAFPWLRAGITPHVYSWLELVPDDPPSDAMGSLLRLLATLAIVTSIAGMAGPHYVQVPVERVGRGAQIVLLLDRSRSMDQPFAGRLLSGTLLTEGGHSGYESKREAARRLLAEFAKRRHDDAMAMFVFTTIPIRVIGFTQQQELIQAAIRVSDIGRGLAETDIGGGLLAALALFARQPYNGSRVIVMVSDGGARLDADTKQHIADLMRRDRVSLYWLYLRANLSPGLLVDRDVAPEDQDRVPEHALHKFFLSIGTPYHAYEAEDPRALQRAIQDVDRLENLPIRYQDILPERDFSTPLYGIALACVASLLIAKFMEIQRWI